MRRRALAMVVAGVSALLPGAMPTLGIVLVEPNPATAGAPASVGIVLSSAAAIGAVRINGQGVSFAQFNERGLIANLPALEEGTSILEVVAGGTTAVRELLADRFPPPPDVVLPLKADLVDANSSPPGRPQPGFLTPGVGRSVSQKLRNAAEMYSRLQMEASASAVQAAIREITALRDVQTPPVFADHLAGQLDGIVGQIQACHEPERTLAEPLESWSLDGDPNAPMPGPDDLPNGFQQTARYQRLEGDGTTEVAYGQRTGGQLLGLTTQVGFDGEAVARLVLASGHDCEDCIHQAEFEQRVAGWMRWETNVGAPNYILRVLLVSSPRNFIRVEECDLPPPGDAPYGGAYWMLVLFVANVAGNVVVFNEEPYDSRLEDYIMGQILEPIPGVSGTVTPDVLHREHTTTVPHTFGRLARNRLVTFAFVDSTVIIPDPQNPPPPDDPAAFVRARVRAGLLRDEDRFRVTDLTEPTVSAQVP